MRTRWWLLLAMLLACAPAWGDAKIDADCDVESDYDLAITERSVIYTRDDGTPKTVLMRGGRLFVDERWVALSAADRERVARYEREARAMMPLLHQLARDAADLAFAAIGEIALAFSDDPAGTRAKLADARAALDARLARSVTPKRFDSVGLGLGVRDAVRDILPTLIGDIVGGAVRVAFSGDPAQARRIENIDQAIDARVKPREAALERNARRLCASMRSLDGIDDSLDYRLPNGRPLALLRVAPPSRGEDHDDEAR